MTARHDSEALVTRWPSRPTLLLAALFITAAATSNWAIENIGRDNGTFAPRTLPIGWGMEAPSGVLLIGLMITVRDALHERVGIRGTLVVIALGSILSALLAPAPIAIASGATLLTAETADALVYQRLRRKGRLAAAASSNAISSVIDSAMFLLIAYGLEAARLGTWPLTVGKVEASLVTLAVIAVVTKSFRPGAIDRQPSTV